MALAASKAVVARKCLRDEILGINPFKVIANDTKNTSDLNKFLLAFLVRLPKFHRHFYHYLLKYIKQSKMVMPKFRQNLVKSLKNLKAKYV